MLGRRRHRIASTVFRRGILEDVLEARVHVPRETGFEASDGTGSGNQVLVVLHWGKETKWSTGNEL